MVIFTSNYFCFAASTPDFSIYFMTRIPSNDFTDTLNIAMLFTIGFLYLLFNSFIRSAFSLALVNPYSSAFYYLLYYIYLLHYNLLDEIVGMNVLVFFIHRPYYIFVNLIGLFSIGCDIYNYRMKGSRLSEFLISCILVFCVDFTFG